MGFSFPMTIVFMKVFTFLSNTLVAIRRLSLMSWASPPFMLVFMGSLKSSRVTGSLEEEMMVIVSLMKQSLFLCLVIWMLVMSGSFLRMALQMSNHLLSAQLRVKNQWKGPKLSSLASSSLFFFFIKEGLFLMLFRTM